MAPVFYYGLFLVLFIAFWFRRRPRTPPLPPGPPADPIIGHTRVIPIHNQEDAYHEWSKTYGTRVSSAYSGTNS
jgi:hypothetical protein